MAPIQNESDFENITAINGEIPKELNGVLYRNGPNPQFPIKISNCLKGWNATHVCNKKR